MKIEIELPEWTDDKCIYIFAGIEMAARRIDEVKGWEVKDGRCNLCGKCCISLTEHIYPIIDGACSLLQKEVGDNENWLCGLAINRPFGCSINTPYDLVEKIDGCTESFKKVV